MVIDPLILKIYIKLRFIFRMNSVSNLCANLSTKSSWSVFPFREFFFLFFLFFSIKFHKIQCKDQ